MNDPQKTAECRHCEMKLTGKPFHCGGEARHPKTRELCKVNLYGGFVCSDDCDIAVTGVMEKSIDEHATLGELWD